MLQSCLCRNQPRGLNAKLRQELTILPRHQLYLFSNFSWQPQAPTGAGDTRDNSPSTCPGAHPRSAQAKWVQLLLAKH